jgi:diguanylate cyclase (GGDEF)-like protein/PAS domain S-box-containing protein
LAVVTCTEEIGERKRAEQALRSSEERYRLLFERNLAGVYRAAPSGRLLECNEAFARLLGYGSAGELLGRGLGELSVARGEQEALTARLRQKGGLTNVERRLRRKDGGSVWVLENATLLTGSDGERVVQGTLIDITDRKEFEERIEFQAYHDVLTGLPNRAALEERLPHLVEQARRAGRGLAVLFLDLDRFKDVNDAHGHSFGDRLLQQVARRLRECVREDDLVSRVGGDEFVVALHRGRRGSARRVAGKVLARLAEPILLEGHELCVTASIGISLFPEDGEDGGALLRSADAAMYRAKESGRNALELAAGGGAVAPATGPRTRPPR